MEDLKKSFLVRGGNIVGAIGDKYFSTLPIGCIAPYLGRTDNIPRGFLFADGSSYKTADYPELFNIIGYTYGGSGDTFNVPNLSDGRFLEGSIISGGYVNAGLPNIEGKWVADSIYTPYFEGTMTGAFSKVGTDSGVRRWGPNEGNGVDTFVFDASKSNPIYGNADTVQPKSLMVLYIIKAFHTNEGVDSGVSDDVIEYVDGEIAEVESKVATELKTSSNTDVTKTPDLKDTTYFDYGNDTVHNYVVRNGICYFTILLLEKTHTTSFVTIMEGLPGALMQTYFSFPPYYSASGDNTSLQVNFSSDGVVAVSMGAKDNTYMLTGSYPIA